MSKYITQIFAISFLAALVVVALLAPILPIADPVAMDVLNRHGGISASHWLGGDEFGRDTLSRIIFGARASLSVALIAALLGGAFGVMLGLVGGYFRGWPEIVTMRPLDIILSFPPMLLALLTVALIGPGMETLTVLLAILFVPAYARVTYGVTLSVRTHEYVEAARSLGHRSGRILFRTILPNVMGPILVQFSLVVASCILLESGLSFLGLGVVPPDSSWGLMIRGARPYMYDAPMQLVWPCIALVLTVYSINRVCDMLRDRLDPKAAVKLFPDSGFLRGLRRRKVPGESSGVLEDRRLEVEDLVVEISTAQGVVRALDGVSFSVGRGETVALVGESGSGKSMTGLSIMQLLPRRVSRIARGRVLYAAGDGENARAIDLSKVPAEQFRAYRGSEIGMVFQEPMSCLNPVYTIGYQIEEALRAHRDITPEGARRQAEEELRRVGIPDPARRLGEYPHQLSGGMRQRVAIAIALCGRPKLLIADEPTTALDVTVQAQILDLIQRLQKENGMSVIFITHDMGVVAEIADRVLVMYKGKLVEQAEAAALFDEPQHPYTQKLLKAVPRLGSMKHEPTPRKMPGVDDLGNEIVPNSEPLLPRPGLPLLEVNGLTKRFEIRGGVFQKVTARLHAVEDLSFSLQPSETLSLVGESGCGKSTTGRTVLQLLKPDSGSVKFEGSEIVGASAEELHNLRRKMQIIFQDPFGSLNPRLTVGKAIAESIVLHKLGTTRQAMEQAVELLRKVGLSPDMAGRFPHAFSGGQRQRICIARALALNPKLIVADEAVSALDVSIKAQVLNLLLDLQSELGLSYLFISHDMATVEQVSHRIAVMYLGEIVEIGPRAAIIENPQHPYTRKLLSAVPVADPAHRGKRPPIPVGDLPSPLRRPDYVPVARVWRKVSDGHLVQETPSM